jgi:hypothetical protein
VQQVVAENGGSSLSVSQTVTSSFTPITIGNRPAPTIVVIDSLTEAPPVEAVIESPSGAAGFLPPPPAPVVTVAAVPPAGPLAPLVVPPVLLPVPIGGGGGYLPVDCGKIHVSANMSYQPAQSKQCPDVNIDINSVLSDYSPDTLHESSESLGSLESLEEDGEEELELLEQQVVTPVPTTTTTSRPSSMSSMSWFTYFINLFSNVTILSPFAVLFWMVFFGPLSLLMVGSLSAAALFLPWAFTRLWFIGFRRSFETTPTLSESVLEFERRLKQGFFDTKWKRLH